MMTSQDFHREHPGFAHRLTVKKTYNGPVPRAVEVRTWLTDTFGPRGGRWQHQPLADPLYLVYWFREERDLAWAQMRFL